MNLDGLVMGCSGWDGWKFDPSTYVGAVNELLPLGKAAVLDGLTTVASGGTDLEHTVRIMFLLRLLFVKSDGAPFPPMRVGAPTDVAGAPLEKFPRYPLVLEKDVPLLMISGFELGGFPEPAQPHIQHCRDHAELRADKLTPPKDLSTVVDGLMGAPKWYRPQSTRATDRDMLQAQVDRLAAAR